ncbi:MAG TPA: polysaccharide deacetylase family protein [Bacillota bacterium]|nr:polysaccharide deacetylase family protein [Bacillota bacterium]
MNVIVITGKQIKRLFYAVVLLATLILTLPQLPNWYRSWQGVAKGVTLEGRPVAGLLPNEIKSEIEKIATEVVRPPRNAGYFQETGELVPEMDGIAVDIPGTYRRVLHAHTGEHLKLITYKVTAARDSSFYIPIYEGSPVRNEVALTFNVAWGEEEVPKILTILKEEKVKATFFFVGTWVEKFPELVRDIDNAGHEIANHGFYHGHPAQMGRHDLEGLILDNQRLLKMTIEREPIKLFAPPYGEFDQDVLNVAGDLGYRTILWTVDTVDWRRPAPEVILERVRQKTRPGTIILMHPTVPTVAALRPMIRDFKQKGFKLVPVSKIIKK